MAIAILDLVFVSAAFDSWDMALALGDKYGRMGNLGLQERGQVEKSMDQSDFQSVKS